MSADENTRINDFSAWLKLKAEESQIPGIRISVSNSHYFPVFVMVVRDSIFFESVANTVDEAVKDLRASLEKHEVSKKPPHIHSP